MSDREVEQAIFASVSEADTPPDTQQPTAPEPPADPQAPIPQPEGSAQPEQQGAEPEPQPGTQEQPKPSPRVPLAEVQEERRKRQEAQERLTAYEREVAELRGQMQALQQLLQGQKPQEPQPPPDIFENPAAAIDHRVREQLSPIGQVLAYNNRMVANAVHGEQTVKEAQEAFDTAIRSRSIDPADYQRIASSPNPFVEAVQWHKRSKTLQTIGDDPEAYFQRRLEEELAKPEIRQRILGQVGAEARSNVAQGSAAPLVALPSLSRAPGTPGQAAPGPLNEEDIFNAAPRRVGRRE